MLEAVLSRWIRQTLGRELADADLAAVSINGKTLCGTRWTATNGRPAEAS